jgi:hypothetical protein
MYREPPPGWQGCKEKLVRKSPCIILHFAGMQLSSQHPEYHNLRQNVTIIFGIVLFRHMLKTALKQLLLKVVY